MGFRLDLVISAIIVGIITMLIFDLNSTMLQNSVDTFHYNTVQTFADISTEVLQEELKTAVEIWQPVNSASPDSVLRFLTTGGDTLKVEREGRNLQVIRKNVSSDTISYDLHLSAIQFDLQPDTVAVPYYLYVQVQTESQKSQHVSFQEDVQTAKGFSEVRYYLRNVHIMLGE